MARDQQYGPKLIEVKRRTIQVKAVWGLSASATMRRYIAVEVLTGSFLGVPWSPWLFVLRYFEERERSIDPPPNMPDRIDRYIRFWMATGPLMTADAKTNKHQILLLPSPPEFLAVSARKLNHEGWMCRLKSYLDAWLIADTLEFLQLRCLLYNFL